MTVLVLTHYAGVGGASLSLSVVVEQLLKAGMRVIMLSPEGPMCAKWRAMGAGLILWDPPACHWLARQIHSSGYPARGLNIPLHGLLSLMKLPRRWRQASQLIHEIRVQERIATVYVNSLVLFPIAGVLRDVRNHSVRIIWQIREVLNEKLLSSVYGRIVQGIAGASTLIIAISTTEARAFEGHAQVKIIHNSVPMSWLSKNQIPLNMKRTVDRVCMTADFHSGKGIDDFVEMARILRLRRSNLEFYLYTSHPGLLHGPTSLMLKVAGYWNDKASLFWRMLDETIDLSLRSGIKVKFGQMMQPEMYLNSTVYVRADRSGCPWGRDVIEAMWAGIPVVATGSSQEFVTEGESGFLVPPGRPELLADRVEFLLRNPTLREKMGQAARERALNLFSPETYQVKLLDAIGLR